MSSISSRLGSVSSNKRVSLLARVVVLALLAGMLLCYKLWIPGRVFPLIPAVDAMAALPDVVNYIIAGLLAAALVAVLFLQHRRVYICALALLLLLLLQDQTRWQPWVYMYALWLLPFMFRRYDIAFILNYSRMLMIGVYFWTGIHKLNLAFLEVTFRSILSQFLRIKDEELIEQLLPLGYTIAFLEIAMAFLLFFPKTRKLGVWAVTLSHMFILLYLSPLGANHNSVVFPWNIAMILIAWVLFYGAGEKIYFTTEKKPDYRLLPVLLLIWLMPAFNLGGRWDHYLSVSLYSSKEERYFVAVSDAELHKIPPAIRRYFITIPNVEGGKMLNASDWCLAELNSPIYPEARVFAVIEKQFCSYNIAPGHIYFVVLNGLSDIMRQYYCDGTELPPQAPPAN